MASLAPACPARTGQRRLPFPAPGSAGGRAESRAREAGSHPTGRLPRALGHVLQLRSRAQSRVDTESVDTEVVPRQAPGASQGSGPSKTGKRPWGIRRHREKTQAGSWAWDDRRIGPRVGPAAPGPDRARPCGGQAGAGCSFPRKSALGSLHWGESEPGSTQASSEPRVLGLLETVKIVQKAVGVGSAFSRCSSCPAEEGTDVSTSFHTRALPTLRADAGGHRGRGQQAAGPPRWPHVSAVPLARKF